MKRKRIILVGAVVALGALVATATAQRGMMRGDGPRVFMQELDLSDEQREQLDALHESHVEEMKELRGELDFEALRALRENHRAQMREILNDEQRDKMEAMRGGFPDGPFGGPLCGHRGGWGRPGGHWGRPGPMMGGPKRGMRGAGRAFAQLELSEEQKAELEALRETHRKEMDKMRQEHRADMEEILTGDQRKQLENLKDESFYGGMRRRGPRW